MAEEMQAKPTEEFVAVPPAPEEMAARAPAQKEEPVGESVLVVIEQSMYFKEESNIVADLKDPEKKSLEELKQLIHALHAAEVVEEKTVEAIEETVAPAVASSAGDPAPPTSIEENSAEAIKETTIPVDTPAVVGKIDANPD